jgi:hypothetical protein
MLEPGRAIAPGETDLGDAFDLISDGCCSLRRLSR